MIIVMDVEYMPILKENQRATVYVIPEYLVKTWNVLVLTIF